jgi:hypothetical protein
MLKQSLIDAYSHPAKGFGSLFQFACYFSQQFHAFGLKTIAFSRPGILELRDSLTQKIAIFGMKRAQQRSCLENRIRRLNLHHLFSSSATVENFSKLEPNILRSSAPVFRRPHDEKSPRSPVSRRLSNVLNGTRVAVDVQ